MPESDWGAIALLCDAAQVADGKLFVIGGGWTLCGPGAFTHALAVKIEVPWDRSNERHSMQGMLLSEDGVAVQVGEPLQEVAFDSDFEVGRPPGLPAGTPLDLLFAINFGPLELPPASGYAWSIVVNDEELTRARFRTRPTSG
ncbi:MAG: hypothetical protein QOC87_1140 [Actinomycetota bacterium]|jgi:hypothetical protein|nr:hypothetical protein [Actinomycetota bacterium]